MDWKQLPKETPSLCCIIGFFHHLSINGSVLTLSAQYLPEQKPYKLCRSVFFLGPIKENNKIKNQFILPFKKQPKRLLISLSIACKMKQSFITNQAPSHQGTFENHLCLQLPCGVLRLKEQKETEIVSAASKF